LRAARHFLNRKLCRLFPAGLPSRCLSERPDIKSAEQLLISENALVSAARKAYFPTISLTGAFGFQSNSLANLFSGASSAWTFIPQITQPIFTAGRLKSNVNLKRLNASTRSRSINKLSRRLLATSLTPWSSTGGKRNSHSAGIAGHSLQDASRLSHLRYEGGVDTLLNALFADTLYQR